MDIDLHGSPVQGLAPKHPTKCAVVLQTNLMGQLFYSMFKIPNISRANLGNNLVHGPAIEILIGENFERDPILVSVSLHRFQ